MGGAGAETAMIEMIHRLDPSQYEVFVFVLLNQGELIHRLPPYVTILNEHISDASVLSAEGKQQLRSYVLKTMFCRGSIFKNIPYLVKNTFHMLHKKKIMVEKLLWRVMSDAAPVHKQSFDLAIAYLEGGSAYYVADHVKADKKVGFIHIDYELAGYGPLLDRTTYEHFDRIYSVSDEVKKHFLNVYPQYEDKTEVFHNIINQEKIRQRAKEPGGFCDDFDGTRILTVGRLTPQKAYEVAIEALKLLKDCGEYVRWYVAGDGSERSRLEAKIREYGLEEDFILLGSVENPYPYYAQTDLYVHATRFEGKSIAIQEAQTLGCTLLVSDCSGNREQVISGVDGLMCELSPQSIKDALVTLIHDKEACLRYAKAAEKKQFDSQKQLDRLLELMEE